MSINPGLLVLAWMSASLAFDPGNLTAAPRSQAANAGSLHACSLLTEAEVTKLIGQDPAAAKYPDLFKADEEALPGGGSACSVSSVEYQVDPFPFAKVEDARKQKPAAWTQVPGVGDVAYEEHTNDVFVNLYARAGQHVVTVQVLTQKVPTNSVEKARHAAIVLAQALIAKLH